ncbi:EamA family transporter [Lactobacillus helveticus]|uniref:Inner membrane transporter YicL n=1 Tax=Lactobacillus helveticus TaxID=1587 RepID=A0A9Q5C633_LACHE|nr:DMT family transporter [Lactobacillus helveticus]NRN88919.1 putative inner membrane transporter YicL [Lactobacillus helveticus]NRN93224.1 putative inner membrane transporter YicL [Lactobacillus helveticus]NRO05768.1 putative inner membrane transporter YicL [Lactobacillus helveticus]NRO26803.1 putative inner membrane transporter YicL [Lactobacillus helveticus]NRO30735.1 putative inner membrane transporter YicL [Lactobacillus helveticus]
MVTQKTRRLWAFLAALACVMWGISGLFAKSLFNVSSEITPMWLSQIRMVTSGIILLIVAVILKQKPIATMKNKHDAWVIIAYGVFGLLPVQLFYFIVVQKANASIATILQFIGPFFVLGYLTITHKQVMRRLDIIAAICAFLGVFLLSTHGQFDHLAITPAALFWGLLSAVGEAAYTLIPVNIVKKESSMVVTGWGMLFAGLSLVIIQPQFQAIPNKSEVWLYTAAVVIIGTIIPFQIMANALRYVVPSTASLLDAFEPFSATIGSVLVFGLIMMPMDWVGAVLVVVAAMALNIIPKKRSNKIGQNKLSK